MWANAFTPYMSKQHFNEVVSSSSDIVFKTKAVACRECNGTGQIRKVRKNGVLYSNTNKCLHCSAHGYLLNSTKVVAGLKFKAPSSKWVSANGFGVSKTNLDMLQSMAKRVNMTDAVNFLTDVKRLSALDSYLSSFVEGIKAHVKSDGKLHVRLLQHRTATGRFSGADPNMQNMPRGGTFPVKKVFISRWSGGKILEADFAQLEFQSCGIFITR